MYEYVENNDIYKDISLQDLEQIDNKEEASTIYIGDVEIFDCNDGEVWKFNQEINLDDYNDSYIIPFSCLGFNYNRLLISSEQDVLSYDLKRVYTNNMWINDEYRLIIFKTSPTGNLLKFLNKYAVKIVHS